MRLGRSKAQLRVGYYLPSQRHSYQLLTTAEVFEVVAIDGFPPSAAEPMRSRANRVKIDLPIDATSYRSLAMDTQ